MPEARYAIYFAPLPESPLARFGNRWLGRDAATGEEFAASPAAQFPDEWWRIAVASPRIYGFHATLKPPFFLAPGRTVMALESAVAAIARSIHRIPLPPLQIERLGRFLALTLAQPCPPLERLAARLVEELDPFRRPATAEELDRRRPGLTPRQLELLERWGYPYVGDQWKFHLTLTSSVPDEALLARLQGYLEEVCPLGNALLAVEDLAIFRQPAAGEPFRIWRRIPLQP